MSSLCLTDLCASVKLVKLSDDDDVLQPFHRQVEHPKLQKVTDWRSTGTIFIDSLTNWLVFHELVFHGQNLNKNKVISW